MYLYGNLFDNLVLIPYLLKKKHIEFYSQLRSNKISYSFKNKYIIKRLCFWLALMVMPPSRSSLGTENKIPVSLSSVLVRVGGTGGMPPVNFSQRVAANHQF